MIVWKTNCRLYGDRTEFEPDYYKSERHHIDTVRRRKRNSNPKEESMITDFLENMNLKEFGEDEETIGGLLAVTVEKGNVRPGYSGNLYFNYEPGDAQFVARVQVNKAEEKLEAVGLDAHAAGHGIWDVVVSDVEVDFKEKDPLQKRIAVKGLNGKGCAVLTLVNADILPSTNAGDRLRLQVAAFPITLHYFRDEDEYTDSLERDKFGQTFGLEDGALLPVGLLHNGNPEKAEQENAEDVSLGYMLVKGTVKALVKGKLQFTEEEWEPFIRCVIDTQFGELEIVHSYQQIPEEQRDNFDEGAVVSCLCLLSADPGIQEYADGAIYDEEHDLLLYKDAVIRQSSNRMVGAIAEDAVYSTQSGKFFEGKANVIDRMKYVDEARKAKNLHARGIMATITHPEEPTAELEYCKGKRCLILCYEEDKYSYGAIAFIDTDGDGKISRLTVSTDSGYRFDLDDDYAQEDEKEMDFTPCTDPVKAMFIRGNIRGFVKSSEDEYMEELLQQAASNPVYERYAEEAEPLVDLEDEEKLAMITASLFARAYEETFADRNGIKYERPLLKADLFGETEMQPGIGTNKEDFEDAVQIGKQLARDYGVLQKNNDEAVHDLRNSLMFIQELGKCYENAIIKENET